MWYWVSFTCRLQEHSLLGKTPEYMTLFDMYMCYYESEGDAQLLFAISWILSTVWEVLALGLSVWIAVKHFRDLRRFGPSTGSTIGGCFKVLTKSHVLYFAR
jgi:hypothetical protein